MLSIIIVVPDVLKESFNNSERNSQKVATELQELKKRLREQRKATEQAEGILRRHSDVLGRSKNILSSLLGDVKDALDAGKAEGVTAASPVKKEEDMKKEIKKEINGE